MTDLARRLVFGLGALVVLTALAAPAFAQSFQGTVRGTIEDSQGGVLPGATVTLHNVKTGETRTQVSTAAGTVHFPNLLVGSYSLAIELAGFKKYERQNIAVAANQTIEVSARLEIGALSDVVTVTGGADLVKTTTSQLEGATFDEKQVADLPFYDPTLLGDVTTMSVLAPGVGTQPGGVVGAGGVIGGNRPRNNNFVVDGLDNNDSELNGPVATPIQDTVQEFVLITNQFNAEMGHSTAGQFITTTKSGTNEFHGGVWGYNINRHLLSLDNLTRASSCLPTSAPGACNVDPTFEKPRLDLNRDGAGLGGPIIKDKLFFYGAYEYQNETLGATPAATILAPTATGLATLQALAANPATGVSPVTVGLLKQHVPPAPGASGDFENVTNDATGATVPIELGSFVGTTPNYTRTHVAQLNLDAQLANHRVSARGYFSKLGSVAGGPLPTAEFNVSPTQKIKRGTLSDVWNVRSNVVNELRLGYHKVEKDFPVTSLTPPGSSDVFGNYAIDSMGLEMGPNGNYPQTALQTTLQIGDTLTWVSGPHTFKAGGEFRFLGSQAGFLPRARGEYRYSSLDIFAHDQNPQDDLALRGAGSGAFIGDRNAYYGFVQDTWKVTPHLTLDLGARYEFTQVPQDTAKQDLNAIANVDLRTAVDENGNNIFNSLRPDHQALLLATFPSGQIVFRKPNADKNNIVPRVGFAWDIKGDGSQSLRGGFGMATDVIGGNFADLQLPPQFQTETNSEIACALGSAAPGWCHVPVPSASTVGFLASGGLPSAIDESASTDPVVARQDTGAFVQDDKLPMTYTWSLSYQREIKKNYLVELRYIGTMGRNLIVQHRLNAGIPDPVQLPIYARTSDALSANYVGAPTLAEFNAAKQQLLTPYGFLGSVTTFEYTGHSIYHGGSIVLSRRITNGLGFNANYTFSKSIDDTENELFTSLLNPRRQDNGWDLASNRGLSGLHHAHHASLSFQWDLPKPSGGLASVLGGWVLNGAFLFETGQPLTIQSVRDQNGTIDTTGQRAFENTSGIKNTGTDTNFVCFNGAAPYIATTGCGADATVGYVAQDPNAQWVRGREGAQRGVGLGKSGRGGYIFASNLHTLNLSLYKNISLGKEFTLRLGVSALNLTNTPNYAIGTGSGGNGGSAYNGASAGGPAGNRNFVIPSSDSTVFLNTSSVTGSLGQTPYQRIIQLFAKLSF